MFFSPLQSSSAGPSRNMEEAVQNATDGFGSDGSFLVAIVNGTASALTEAAAEGLRRNMQSKPDWGGAMMGWLRSLQGREFSLPCINVQVRL